MINYTERLTLLMQDIVVARADAVVHRHARRAGVRARRPLERRRRVRHLPLPEPAAERARLLLLARSRDAAASRAARSGSSPSRRVVTIGTRADQVHDLVRAAALLRSVARPLAQGAVLSRRRAVDREARHGRARAVSHRSASSTGIRRIERDDGTYSANCHGQQFFEQVAEMVHDLPGQHARSRRSTTFCGTTSPRSKRATAASSARASGRSRRFRSATSSGSPSSRRARPTPTGVEGRAAARAAAADALHRGRSARPRSSSKDTSRRLIRKGQFSAA